MKKLILIFLSLTISFVAHSQRTHSLEMKLYGGKIIMHRMGMDALAKNTLGGELNYYFQTRSNNFYDLKYKFPLHGFGISYDFLGNRNTLGSAYSAYSFMEFDLFSRTHFKLGFRANTGLAYLTNKYDKITNSSNVAISTNICFYFNICLNTIYRFSSGYELKFSPGFLHYSNGAVRKPNLGLNQFYLALSLSKDIKTTEYNKQRIDYQDKLSPHEVWLMGTCVTADEYSVGREGRGGGFLCSTVALGYNYQYGKIGKAGISFDMFYNENFKYTYDEQTATLVTVNDKFSDIMRLGIGVGHQLVYKRFELVTFIGTYLYNKIQKDDWLYVRIGGRYYVTDFMFVNLTLNAKYFSIAQYIECGIGFSYRKKKS